MTDFFALRAWQLWQQRAQVQPRKPIHRKPFNDFLPPIKAPNPQGFVPKLQRSLGVDFFPLLIKKG